MTRKHFEILASELRHAKQSILWDDRPESADRMMVFEKMLNAILSACKQSNPNFNPEKI
jgi:hypothetical protein